jgi:conjugative transfer signal peptidase TraF
MSRFGYVMVTYFAMVAVGISAAIAVPVQFIWNASASTPIGLYSLHEIRALHVGDLVAVDPPAALARFMVARRYISAGVPLLKHVAALPGQTICRRGATVSIDGAHQVNALSVDRHGRPLPVWKGCRTIARDQIFLLNPAVQDSFDGRYFESLPARTITGLATPIYTDDAGHGHFVWHGFRGGGG